MKSLCHLQDFSRVYFSLQMPHLQGNIMHLSHLNLIKNAIASINYDFVSIYLLTGRKKVCPYFTLSLIESQ